MRAPPKKAQRAQVIRETIVDKTVRTCPTFFGWTNMANGPDAVDMPVWSGTWTYRLTADLCSADDVIAYEIIDHHPGYTFSIAPDPSDPMLAVIRATVIPPDPRFIFFRFVAFVNGAPLGFTVSVVEDQRSRWRQWTVTPPAIPTTGTIDAPAIVDIADTTSFTSNASGFYAGRQFLMEATQIDGPPVTFDMAKTGLGQYRLSVYSDSGDVTGASFLLTATVAGFAYGASIIVSTP